MRQDQWFVQSLILGASMLGCGGSRPVNETALGNAMADKSVVEKHLAAAGMTGEILRLDDRGECWEVSLASEVQKSTDKGGEREGSFLAAGPIRNVTVTKADGKVVER